MTGCSKKAYKYSGSSLNGHSARKRTAVATYGAHLHKTPFKLPINPRSDSAFLHSRKQAIPVGGRGHFQGLRF